MLYRITLICPPDRVDVHYLNLCDMDLTIQNIDNIERGLSLDMAACLGIQHKNFLETVRKYKREIEQHFGRVAFKTEPLQTAGGVQNISVAWLTEDQAIFIGTLSRNSEKVVEFKAWLVKAFRQNKQDTSLVSPADILLQSAKLLKDHETRLKEVEAKISTKDESYYTISGFSRLHGLSMPVGEARRLGKQAKKLSDQLGYTIGSEHDAKYGHINSYHTDILNQIFNQKLLS